MKRYDWIRLGTFRFTWDRPLNAEDGTKTVDLNDPSLPDEIVEIKPDADAFPAPDED